MGQKVRSFFAEPNQHRESQKVFRGRRATIEPTAASRTSVDARESMSTPLPVRRSRRQSMADAIENEIRARNTLVEQKSRSKSLLDFIREEDELAEKEDESENENIE